MEQRLALLVYRVAERFPYDFSTGVVPMMYDRQSPAIRALRLIASLLGAKLIGVGAFRVAFLYNGVVLKVARNQAGAECNRREKMVWEKASAGIRPHLVPVIGYDEPNGVISMEYAPERLAGSLPWSITRHILNETRDIVQDELQDLLGTAYNLDLHSGNITEHHRILDYAGARFE